MDRTERLCGWLRDTLGYTPRDGELFEQALTHRSVGSPNNERLEFLGDAVLGLVIARYLFERFEGADEGQLSRLRARVVSGESLAQLAGALGLSDWLVLGPGEIKTGGAHRESILADALEALCGALYLDGGLAAARRVMLRVVAPALRLDAPDELKDPKTRLQELLQARGLALPRYRVESVGGALHAQVFRVTCEVPPMAASASATGSSRRRAEQAAAALVLAQLEAARAVDSG
ncbi:MAG TPA: ribonuclease III [Steroidobacteraceae bacterium]|nr:ribonuclease III [Steroidobacteraceae bacterium]